jgi:hypothetical protein
MLDPGRTEPGSVAVSGVVADDHSMQVLEYLVASIAAIAALILAFLH